MSWIIEEIEGCVIVRMNSNKMNLINDGFFDDLNNAFDLIEQSHCNQPVIITSDMKVFSAGLDINHCYNLFKKGDTEEIKLWFEGFRDAILRVFRFDGPIISAVNGHAIAGGLILALCCDLRVAVDQNARFGLNEVQVGFPFPASLAVIVKHIMGTPRAEELIYKSKLYESGDALSLGLFHKITNPENLLEEAVRYGSMYTEPGIIESYSYAKRVLRFETVDEIRKASLELDDDLPELLSSEKTVGSLGKVIENLARKKG